MTEQRGTGTFRAPAAAYDRYIGRYGAELARALCDAAGVRGGGRALDVGAGPGALTGELVARLGAANVAAAEPSPPFAEACRTRHPGVRVEVAPGEALPFADGEFDHVLAQLVVNFMADPPRGVREMVRVARRGGTVAAAVWDYAGGMTLIRRFWDAAVALDPAAEPLDEGRSMPFCTRASLLALWTGAGLADPAVEAAEVSAGYDGFADLWAPLESGVGPVGVYVAGLAPGRREALREELRVRLGVPDEPFRLTARAWIATGVQHRIQPPR